jgi:hypothetical protein
MWSSPSRCESTAGIPAHQNPFAALVNVPENVACTRAASQPVEVSPLELSVAGQIRLCHDRDGHPSYNTRTARGTSISHRKPESVLAAPRLPAQK